MQVLLMLSKAGKILVPRIQLAEGFWQAQRSLVSISEVTFKVLPRT